MKNVILLDTSIASLNQGDEIINLSIKKNWVELFQNNYILKMASHTPMYTFFQSKIYKEKLDVIRNADYKFLCGTNALYTNMLRPLPTWNINLLDCGLAKGTICLGVGLGVNSKSTNWYTKKLYRKVLSSEYIHSTRDERTKEFLEKLGFRAVNTGCPTLWGMTEDVCMKIPRKKSNSVIFTLTYYDRDVKNDNLLIQILRRNYEKVYFWPQCLKDLEYFQSLNCDFPVEIILPNVDNYSNALSRGVDYIGNRLHGGIFALQHFCRTIIIAIDYRAREMHKNYSFVCIERTDTENLLESMILSEWETRISGLDFNLIQEWKRQFSYGE